MSSYDKIHPFVSTGNNATDLWRKWRSDFLDYLEANNLTGDAVTDKRKIAVFRRVCGEELKNKFDSLELSEDPKLDDVLKKFDESFKKCSNEVFASYMFWSYALKQEEHESFESFYKRVRESAVDCNFQDAKSRHIRDKLIIGIRNHALRERMLRENVLDEKSVVEQCRVSEQSRLHSELMSGVPNRKPPVASLEVLGSKQKQKESNKKCKNCGRIHAPKKCPAFGQKCENCGKLNHWKKVCRSSAVSSKDNNRKKVHELQNTENQQQFFISELSLGELNNEWIINAEFDGNVIMCCKIDTGAQVNVISKHRFDKLRQKPEIRETITILRAFGGSPIDLLGRCNLNVTLNNIKLTLLFEISKVDTKTIIGLEAAKKFGLLMNLNEICSSKLGNESPEAIIEEFADVFQGNGSLQPMKIVLKENAIPNVAFNRKIPLALQEVVKNELNTMEENGIITKVNRPTDWVSNFHIIKKSNGTHRIVLDPRPLNKFIKRPHFYIPSVDELLVKTSECRFFTVLDAKTAFWQQPLEEESSYLTTFTTPFGRFRFLKVPYGLVNAPENFQRIMYEIFKDIDGVEPYFDDIIIGSKSIEEHCIILRKVLEAARKHCLKFNRDKVQLAQPEIKYLGQNLSKDGLSTNPSRVKSIVNYPVPTKAEELNRFLAMYRFNSNFIENLSHHTHSLRLLLKKNSVWSWDENHQKCFDDLKQRLIQSPVLQIFNPSEPITLSVDASGYGLGATLLQKGKPIGFGSATLKEEQKRYAQIEKELLAVAFGLRHFNFYTYGRSVTVETDHKPLVGLKEKPFESISPRLQRLLYKVIQYDYQLKYVPGKELATADALSRAPLSSVHFDPTELKQMNAANSLSICVLATATDKRWEILKEQTAADPQLQSVVSYIVNGWPENKKEVKSAASQFWHCREELHIVEGIVCRGQRLVIPLESQQYILSLLHEAHDGSVACKSKAREFFYWVRMNDDIDNILNNCDICQKYQKANSNEPMLERRLPTRPWEVVGADFFELAGKHYLLIIDYFSKFIELQLMHGTNASSVITASKCIYSRYGIPEELISDRGPPFTSKEMCDFYKDWNIHHNPSTPIYARSNGEVERCVQTIKSALTKAYEDGKDPFIVLLNYRTTSKNGLPSPAELMMGRRLRNKLLVHPEKLEPTYPTASAKLQLRKNQIKQKMYADKSTKRLSDLFVGDRIWFQKKKQSPWTRGVILEANNQHRSYKIKALEGREFIRNRVYIRRDSSKSTFFCGSKHSVEDYYAFQYRSSVEPPKSNSNDENLLVDPVSDDEFISADFNEYENEELDNNPDEITKETTTLNQDTSSKSTSVDFNGFEQEDLDNNPYSETATLDPGAAATSTRSKRTCKQPSYFKDFELNF